MIHEPTGPVFARACATAALGGLAIALGGAPHEAFAVAWLGPGMLAVALEAVDAQRSVRTRSRLVRASAVGLAAGVAANGATCSWSVELLSTYAAMPTPVAWLVSMLLFVAQSLPFVLAAVLASASRALGAPLEVALPSAFVVASSAAPMIFPWRIGNSQTGFLALAQIAELGGLPLLDAVLASASALALRAIRAPHARFARLAGALVLVGVPAIWGDARLREVRAERLTRPTLRVGVVQHAFDVPERRDPAQWEAQFAITTELTRELEREGVALVAWPESAFPWAVSRAHLARFPRELDLPALGVRGPIVLGATTHSEGHRYNSVLAVDATRVLGLVDKAHLMPFSERIPGRDWLRLLDGVLPEGLTPGDLRGGVIDVGRERLGILNCYEDLMAEHVWRTSRLGASLLSNHTNDAWFGRTNAAELHHFLARMRAIETRRDLVRTVNTGVSGLVAATGETEERTGIFERRAFVVTARPSREMTPWMRWGDWVTPAAWGALLGLYAAAVRLRATRTEWPPSW